MYGLISYAWYSRFWFYLSTTYLQRIGLYLHQICLFENVIIYWLTILLLNALPKLPPAYVKEDWRKLQRVLHYQDDTQTRCLRLGMITLIIARTYVDALSSFAVHSDFISHTDICISMGMDCFYANSSIQKIDTMSSCQAEMASLAKWQQILDFVSVNLQEIFLFKFELWRIFFDYFQWRTNIHKTEKITEKSIENPGFFS